MFNKLDADTNCPPVSSPLFEIEAPWTDSDIYKSYGKCISPTYPNFLKKLGLHHVAVKAEGAVIIDSRGNEFIDCVGGYGVFNLGHNHPQIVQALIDQLQQKTHATRPLISELAVRLAETISSLTGGALAYSFLCNSGSEAIDNAIKLARLYRGRKQIVAAEGSFHGYTCGALSVSGIAPFKRLFEPLVPDIVHVPFGELDRLKQVVSDRTAAVLLEPVQHEAGVVLPPDGYFPEVRKICDKKDIVLILDEVKTGLGKTARMLACERFGILPDVLVLGKSLGGGMIPTGAMAAKEKFWKKFGLSFPMSASSYAWNALACRAAITAIGLIRDGGLVNACAEKGAVLLDGMQALARKYPTVLKKANGVGLLIGLEAVHTGCAARLTQELIRSGVLAMPAFGNAAVLMFEPPLVISPEQIQKIIGALELGCEKLCKKEKEAYADM